MSFDSLIIRLSTKAAILGLLSIILGACQSTSSGIGGKPPAGPGYEANSPSIASYSRPTKNVAKETGVKVLNIDFAEALDLAHEAANMAFKGRTTLAETGVIINNQSFWMGDVQAGIDPILIIDTDSEKTGFIYEVVATGVGYSASMSPGYVSIEFFKALGEVVKSRGINILIFDNYERSADKGIAEKIAPSVPVDQVQFRNYVDSIDNRDPFIGVWQLDGGEYTLGMVRDERDPLYKYKMFVLDSQYKNWAPGEIKIMFSRLDIAGLAVSRYLGRDKTIHGITFESRKDLLNAINSPFDAPIVLIKTYPVIAAQSLSSSGTSWHVGDGYFVTNAHVVEGARTIDLMINNNAVPARVVSLDKRIDIAVIKAADKINLPRLPIGSKANIGEHITVIGYPLGASLGSSPKITDGVLSGATGVNSDPTRYLVSAPIQPGNSGGPVFGNNGYVIAVAVSKIASTETDNVGFAIKSSYVIPLLKELGIQLDKSTAKGLSPEILCKRFCDAVVQVNVK